MERDIYNAIKSGDTVDLENLIRWRGDWCVDELLLSRTRPVCLAVKKGHDKCLSVLIWNGADVNLTDVTGDAAIHYACRKGRTKTLRLLIAAGCNVNQVCGGMTPLCCAVAGGHVRCVRELLNANVAPTSGIDSPLRLAVKRSNSELVSLLIAAGNDVNDHCWNQSLVGIAANQGVYSIMSQLIETGALIHHKEGFEGKLLTPFEIAVTRGHQKTAQVIWRFVERKGIAFVMGKSKRVGLRSPVRLLPVDLIDLVLLDLFGLTI